MNRGFPSWILLLLPFLVTATRGDDRVQFGRPLIIQADETVTDAVCIGCSIRVDGSVIGDAIAIGGDIVVNGTIDGDAVALGGTIRLASGARISADAVALGGTIEREQGGVIGGEPISIALPLDFGSWGVNLVLILLLTAIGVFIVNFLVALAVFFIAGEQRIRAVGAASRIRPGLTLLAGLVACVAGIMLLVMSSLLGPLTPLLVLAVLAVFFVTLVLGYTGLSFQVGHILIPESGALAAVLLGALLMTILVMIPVVNIVALPLLTLLALGSAFASGYGDSTDWLAQQFR